MSSFGIWVVYCWALLSAESKEPAVISEDSSGFGKHTIMCWERVIVIKTLFSREWIERDVRGQALFPSPGGKLVFRVKPAGGCPGKGAEFPALGRKHPELLSRPS